MVILDHFLVVRSHMKLEKTELINVVGGAISASMISAIVRGINSFLDLGRSIGTAIRRIQSGRICSL